MDLKVVWDGSHQSVDADLLCCPPVRQKRPLGSVPRISDPTQSDACADAVRACLGRGTWHVPELAALTGFSRGLIVLAIERLRRAGVLECVPASRGERGVGVPWMRYTLRGGKETIR